MEHGALLNPRIDSTFKALFTQPTPESRAALHSFLEAAIEQKIKSFQLTSNDVPVSFNGQRGVSYDIACVLDDGRIAEIEMQAFNQEYDYGKRAEYHVARLETTYLEKGDDWEKAPVVFQITVLNFHYTPKKKHAINRYSMRTKDGLELSNTLNIIFIELPKITKFEKSIETNSKLENWALFLKEADNPKKQEFIQNLTSKEDGLMNAQKSLSRISADKALWIAQWKQESFERDIRSGLHAAERRGIQQGAKANALANAKNLLAMHILTVEQIAQACGLSVEEVQELQK
ncbi:MAG: Rpn family recombination-promoting nuclease/putative transposase [Treponema sp.]|nr:Rpn family recombination-promoting nuclease/putative transposase [Treponema sp.]